MRLLAVSLSALVFSFAGTAAAQVLPQPTGGDPRLQAVEYVDGSVVQLRGAPGFQMLIDLSPDEQVENVALGDSAAWQVSVSKTGNRLFLKPAQPDIATNMTVVTSVRTYAFELYSMASPTPDMPYTVEFRYAEPKPQTDGEQYVDVSSVSRRLSKYKVGGSRALRPTSVSDDGTRTWIAWPASAPIPAVYAIDRTGSEVLVNGMMGTDGVYVVDGAPLSLKFRIDNEVAWARRTNPRKAR